MAARGGLGKGLDSLIPAKKEEKKPVPVVETVKEEKGVETIVKITKVEPNRSQPRKNFDEDALQELADSVKQFGVIQPILVQDRKDHYEIPDPDFVNFFKNPAAYKAPEGGETFEQVCKRTTDFLVDIAKHHDPKHKTILVSTHGAALRGLLSSFTITDIGQFWQGGVHKNCGVSLVKWDGSKFSLEWENRIYYEDTKSRAFFEE